MVRQAKAKATRLPDPDPDLDLDRLSNLVARRPKDLVENYYALRGVTIRNLGPGLVCIAGRSGCGKTTLLRAM